MSSTIGEINANPSRKNKGVLGELFQRPFFLSSTIGIPFCLFKLLFGITAIQIGRPDNRLLTVFGGIIVIWATVDLAMNIGRSVLDLLHRPATTLNLISLSVVSLYHEIHMS